MWGKIINKPNPYVVHISSTFGKLHARDVWKFMCIENVDDEHVNI